MLIRNVAGRCKEGAKKYEKPTFGSTNLVQDLKALSEREEIQIELVGLCTDICLVSNALLLKAFMPEVKISVDASCCAGVTPQKHEAALETMRSCQVHVSSARIRRQRLKEPPGPRGARKSVVLKQCGTCRGKDGGLRAQAALR